MAVAPISAPPPSVAEVIVSTRAIPDAILEALCLGLGVGFGFAGASLALALAPRRLVLFLCFRRHLVSLLVLLLATFSCLSTI